MELAALEERLGYSFAQRGLLEQAVTHRSYGSVHNERLEFLGDAVLNCAIAQILYAKYARLDEGDLRERITRVHRLNNAFAQNVAFALQQWLQTERQAEAQADLAISPFEQIEREVIVVPELATNSLIVSATPRFYQEVEKVITELDERPPMVLIQVLIAQVQLSDTDQFGVHHVRGPW